MRQYLQFLRYIRPTLRFIFYPNPGQAAYGSGSALLFLLVCVALIGGSFAIRFWRQNLSNPITKKLSRSWSFTSFWFGVVGMMLIVCRVEQIQFLAMRLWWGVWIASLLLYVFFQLRQFRARHYEVLPRERAHDPRDQYLPGKKSK